MRIAIVLGAGATLAHALHLRSRGEVGDLPPLDTTFFDVLCELEIKTPTSLREYASELLGEDPFVVGGPRPRMEEFFKDVFYDFISDRKQKSPSAERYGQLVVAYRSVLLPTTEWLCEATTIGPLADLLVTAANAASHVDIITFNHDILVENALSDLDEAQGRWCLRHGYGHFAAKRHLTSQKNADMFDDIGTCSIPSQSASSSFMVP
ncbi:MAG TPA: hypothetical protein VFH67_06525 [bacterium]|nr:hypothetical protein [bacterium]